jgi:hypothetical protein
MLIYTVSLKLQLLSYITIFNQCLNVSLVSPVYFGNGVVCPKLSNQPIDIGAKICASFEINATQDEFESALLCKLQRYSDNQYNIDTLTAETNENVATYFYMLVAWKVKDAKSFAYVALVEHAKEFTWNEYKLRKSYNKNHSRFKEYDSVIIDTWLMDDNTVLKTTFMVTDSKKNFELSISISEEGKDNYAMRPFRIHLEK